MCANCVINTRQELLHREIVKFVDKTMMFGWPKIYVYC